MNTYALIASASIALALHAVAAPSIEPDLQLQHEHAVALFKQQRYAAAYGRFMRLADVGHVPSARAALVMLHSGRDLFGQEWTASAVQQKQWAAMLAEASPEAPAMTDSGD